MPQSPGEPSPQLGIPVLAGGVQHPQLLFQTIFLLTPKPPAAPVTLITVHLFHGEICRRPSGSAPISSSLLLEIFGLSRNFASLLVSKETSPVLAKAYPPICSLVSGSPSVCLYHKYPLFDPLSLPIFHLTIITAFFERSGYEPTSFLSGQWILCTGLSLEAME